MSQQAFDDTGRRVATAFFDSRDAAEAAQRDLTAAGFHPDTIAVAGGEASPPPADAPVFPEDAGFWHALKEFFMPDEDRFTYAEGLRRGGFVLSVTTGASDYARVIDILDADGAVDIDERERDWQADGWSGWHEGMDPVAGPARRPDNSTAGFGASYAGEDGFQPALPHDGVAIDAEGAEAQSRADTARVGTGQAGTLNPDMRERIGAGTASMTAPTPTGAQDAALNDNAAMFDRKAAVEDASLGSPTRSGNEGPASGSTIGSTNEDREDGADPWSTRRDTDLQRAKVRGFIVDPRR